MEKIGEHKLKQTVLITGASRGIGAAVAQLFAKKGCRLILNYREREDQINQLCSTLDTEVLPIRADISKAEQVKQMVEQGMKAFGSIDVLVNNAGIAEQKLFSDITLEDWDRMFDVNVKGMYLVTKEVLPSMIHQKRGNIINLSSIWGLTGASCEVHYSASKAAVIGFTKALAKELGPSGIRVNCVAPGVITTDMNAHLSEEILKELKEETPLGSLGTPWDIAEAIWFLSRSSFITGQVLSPNGGMVI